MNSLWMKWLSYCLIGMLLLAWAHIGWVMLYPYEPIRFHSVKILNKEKEVLPGGKLLMELSYTKYTPLTAQVYRQLVNAYVLNASSHESNVPSGSGTAQVSVNIPEFAEPGKYRIVSSYIYTVSEWPIRRVTVRWESEEFTVLRPEAIEQLAEAVEEVREILQSQRKKSAHDSMR